MRHLLSLFSLLITIQHGGCSFEEGEQIYFVVPYSGPEFTREEAAGLWDLGVVEGDIDTRPGGTVAIRQNASFQNPEDTTSLRATMILEDQGSALPRIKNVYLLPEYVSPGESVIRGRRVTRAELGVVSWDVEGAIIGSIHLEYEGGGVLNSLVWEDVDS